MHSREHGLRLGLSIMKMRFLRALHGAGLPFHELSPARLTYPRDGAMAGYFYRHPDPVIPVYWLADEIAPSVLQAIARYQSGQGLGLPQPDRPASIAAEPESTTHDTKAQPGPAPR